MISNKCQSIGVSLPLNKDDKNNTWEVIENSHLQHWIIVGLATHILNVW